MKAEKLVNGIAAIALAAGLAACGSSSDDGKKETQVAAKVDGAEITVHQLNFALTRAGAVSEAQAKQAQKKLLGVLVEQELLLKKAVEQKLDRDPQVIQAIDASRRQLLSQAYMDKILQQASKPTANDVDEYYAKHPELFEKRRIYRLQEMQVAATPENFEAVKGQVAQSKSLEELAAWLKSKNIQYTGKAGVKAAEELPMALVTQFNQMKDGQLLGIRGNNAMQVIQLVASQEQSVTKAQATPAIQRFLFNLKRNELAQAELKKLRDAAKIEYVGAFADAAPAAKDAAPATAPAKPDADFLEKGLSGLK